MVTMKFLGANGNPHPTLVASFKKLPNRTSIELIPPFTPSVLQYRLILSAFGIASGSDDGAEVTFFLRGEVLCFGVFGLVEFVAIWGSSCVPACFFCPEDSPKQVFSQVNPANQTRRVT
jgi:hypothetical protein